MVYLTVHNDATWRYLQKANANQSEGYLLNRLLQVEPAMREMLAHDLPAGRTIFRYTDVGPYRALAFHSDAYLKKTWGRFFEIAETEQMGHGICQSVFVGINRKAMA